MQDVLDRLPRAYTPEMCRDKCSRVYQHILDAYAEANRSVYTPEA